MFVHFTSGVDKHRIHGINRNRLFVSNMFHSQPTELVTNPSKRSNHRNSNPIERRSFTHCITSLTFTFRVFFYKLIHSFQLLPQFHIPERDMPRSLNTNSTHLKHSHCFPFLRQTNTPTNHECQSVWDHKMRRVTDSRFQENAHLRNTQLYSWKPEWSTYWLIFEIHRALDLSDGGSTNSNTLAGQPFAFEGFWLDWGDTDFYR